jgi:hypothetical protein
MDDASEESDESNGDDDDDVSGSAGESNFASGTDSDDDDAPDQPRIGLRAPVEELAQIHEQQLAAARLAASNRNWLRVEPSTVV